MPLTVTADNLAAIAGHATPLMPDLAQWFNTLWPQYGVDTPHEACHFLAQACHETDHFRTLREYASGNAYEGRADLGNTQPGDGPRFRGRGIFQTTGRANYQQLGVKKGQPDLFINQPELLEQPEYAVWSACEYWRTRGLNDIASHADGDVLKKKYRGAVLDLSPVEYISYTINGGNNGLDERKKYYAIAQQVLGDVAQPAPAGARAMPMMPLPPRATPAPRKAAPKKAAAKKPTAKKTAPTKAPVKKTATKKAAPKKAAAKKAPVKKAAAKKAPAKKPASRKTR